MDHRPSLSAFDLLLACGREAHRSDRRDRITASVRRCADWANVVPLAERHGAIPHVWRCLTGHADVPPEVLRELEARQRVVALEALRLTGVLADLLTRMAGANIRAIPLKGPVLARQTLGDPTLRAMADLDVLVAPADVEAADGLLRDAGFVANIPSFDRPRHRRHFLRYLSEMQYVHWKRGVLVELHWRLTMNPHLFPMPEGWPHETESVPLGTMTAQALTPPDQLIYLSVHGASHAWTHVRWLFDLVPLLERCDPAELRTRALGLRAVPFVAQAFVLLRDLLSIPIPDGWDSEVADARVVWRAAVSRERIASKTATIPGPRYEWTLGRGPRFLFFHAALKLQDAVAWQEVPLPGGLLWLYVPLRPYFFLRRRLRHRSAQPEVIRLSDHFRRMPPSP